MKQSYYLLLCLFICAGCGSQKIEIDVTAKILSINTMILQGNLNAVFLSSSNGNIANDVNKIGIDFTIAETRFLQDIILNHAETATLIGHSSVELECELYISYVFDQYKLYIRYYGRTVGIVNLSEELAIKIADYYGGR